LEVFNDDWLLHVNFTCKVDEYVAGFPEKDCKSCHKDKTYAFAMAKISTSPIRKGRQRARKLLNYFPSRRHAGQSHDGEGNAASCIRSRTLRSRAFLICTFTGEELIIGRWVAHECNSDPRDMAPGPSTDGFCSFKKRKATAWPPILSNYNLTIPPAKGNECCADELDNAGHVTFAEVLPLASIHSGEGKLTSAEQRIVQS
jgi:hypothetical protein